MEHHVARGQESNRHRRHARYRLCHRLCFIEEGAAVTVFGSRQETADAAVEKLAAAYPEPGLGPHLRLTSLEAVTEAFTEAAADMGGLIRSSTTPASPSARRFWIHGRRVRQGHGPQRRRCL
ncbi:MAG: hypothetical protein ACLTYW_05135 [Collinsella sp.]